MEITGACDCGKIRWRARERPQRVSHCHCETCRRTTGAVAATLARFAADAIAWEGTPRRYRSSEFAFREFCPDCGSSLTFRVNDRPEAVYIAVGSMDDPSLCPAERHSWARSRIAWLHLDEHLPSSETWLEPPAAAPPDGWRRDADPSQPDKSQPDK